MNVKINEKNQDQNYITRNWEALAGCAWKEYREHGRGALLVGGFNEPGDFIFLPLEVMVSHPLLKDFARFAEEYDPTREVVVIFLRPPHSVRAYRGSMPDRRTPPEMYERQQPVLHEK
jgi:hypothetical protein